MDLAVYRIMRNLGGLQLHHITCTERITLLVEWPETMAGGMSIEALLNVIANHELTYHIQENVNELRELMDYLRRVPANDKDDVKMWSGNEEQHEYYDNPGEPIKRYPGELY